MNVKEAGNAFVKDKKMEIIISILIVILILTGVAIYLNFFKGEKCGNYECFKEAMANCQKASFINEDKTASWGYNIIGKNGGECIIRVKLLQAKEGTLNIDELRGYSMDCYYPLGLAKYPESDLSMCHGRLKESLQEIIINKLYTYIVDNLGQVGESLRNAV